MAGYSERNVNIDSMTRNGRIYGDRDRTSESGCVVREVSGLKPWELAKEEYGIVSCDKMTRDNLRKLLIATQRLNRVVIIRWSSKYEEQIGLLTASPSGRIILREILPDNLATVTATETFSVEGITEEQIKEAEQFVKTLAEATDDVFKANDWRARAPQPEEGSKARVVELEKIVASAAPIAK